MNLCVFLLYYVIVLLFAVLYYGFVVVVMILNLAELWKLYSFFFSIEFIFDSSKKIVSVHIDLIFKSIRTESKLYRLLDLYILKL